MDKEDEIKRSKETVCGEEEKIFGLFGSVLRKQDLPLSLYGQDLLTLPSGVEESEEGTAAPRELVSYKEVWLEKPPREETVSYKKFKKDFVPIIRAAVEGAVDKRLQKTEDLISAQLQLTEGQILSAIKHSPFAFMNLFSRIGLAVFGLFFALYVVSEIYLVHPYFSLFGIFSCAAYLAMSKIGQVRHNKRHAPNES